MKYVFRVTPERIIYDRAADSDKLRDAFERRGINLSVLIGETGKRQAPYDYVSEVIEQLLVDHPKLNFGQR